MNPLPLAEGREVLGDDHARMAPAEDELSLGERSPCVDTTSLRTCVEHFDIADHVPKLRDRARHRTDAPMDVKRPYVSIRRWWR